MAVIEKQMSPLNANDVAGSLNTVESYIRYMAERIEFSSGVTRRKLTNVGAEGIEEITQAITELNGEISRLSSSLSSMSGQLTNIGTQLAELEERVNALEEV